MTRERIELVRKSVIPFVKKKLLEIDYEGLGESDAEEFENDINEIFDLADKALGMTPEEAIEILNRVIDGRKDKRGDAKIDTALKAACASLSRDIQLKKIREEMERKKLETDCDDITDEAYDIAVDACLAIIDKHMKGE